MSSAFNTQKGFGLVETLVGVAIFMIVSISAYQVISGLLQGVKLSKLRTTATNLANEQLEIIRNLQYDNIGIINGLPAGTVPRTQILERGGTTFNVTATIRDIDIEFDGTIGGSPNDLSPADNKLVAIEVDCGADCIMDPVEVTAHVAPKGLETTGNNGALFVQVFNANGQPLQDADVHIENNTGTTTIEIDDVTNSQGLLQIVNAPPGNQAYEITVSKDGYSSEKTYLIGDAENPVPNKPHATVVQGQVTQVSFAIDLLSEIDISTKRSTCAPVGGIDFSMTGSKEIGLNTFKYDETHTTNGSGALSIGDIEWDTYTFGIIDSVYHLAGSNTILPLDLLPNTIRHIDFILEPKNPNSLLVQVKDGSTGLPLSDTTVTLEKNGSTILTTGRGFLSQSDWSGGSGQTDFSNENRYFSSNGNIDTNNPAGDLTLTEFAGEYVLSGELESSTFDMGTTTNFYTFSWTPASQPIETGEDSVRFQIATNELNTATTTWNYVGPNGTAGSYFTSPGESFNSAHNGDRYLRYKAYLSTDSATSTPNVSDVSFVFSSECVPSGQVFFTGLSAGTHSLTVTKDGYQTYLDEDFPIAAEWQSVEIILTP